MTSSANINGSSKTLTDFSIESIIGQPQPNQQQRQPQQPCYHDHSHQFNHQKLADDHLDYNQNDKQEEEIKYKLKTLEEATPGRRSRPKNFQCPACKMAFSNNGQLKNHVRIHTGERPFMCNHPNCNKTFTRNEELTRHKLIHTGVRPHTCTTCGKKFGRKDHLKKHMRTHTRKRLRRKVFVPPETTTKLDEIQTTKGSSRSQSLMTTTIQSCATTPTMTSTAKLNPRKPQEPQVIRILQRGASLSAFAPPPVGRTFLPVNITTPITTTSANTFHPSLPTSTATTTMTTTNLEFPPSTTSMSNSYYHDQHQSSSLISVANSNTIQQLANDYWYNLMGFYHNHQRHIAPNPSWFSSLINTKKH